MTERFIIRNNATVVGPTRAKRNLAVVRLDSVDELATVAMRPPVSPINERERSRKYAWATGDLGDVGFDNAAVAAMLRSGRRNDAERMIRDVGELSIPPLASWRRRPSWSEDSGDELDRDRWRAGAPAWRTMRREARSGSAGATVTLVVPCAFSSGESHEAILWTGAAVVAVANALEASGRACSILLASTTAVCGEIGGVPTDDLIAVCMKRHDEPLDVARLATMAHPAFFRRAIFACMEAIPGIELHDSYGRPHCWKEGSGDGGGSRFAGQANDETLQTIARECALDDFIGLPRCYSKEAAQQCAGDLLAFASGEISSVDSPSS